MVDLLVERGVDITATDRHGRSAAELAAEIPDSSLHIANEMLVE